MPTVEVAPSVLLWARETALATVDEAAHRLGAPVSRVVDLEAGRIKPTYAQLEKLAVGYGVSMNVFLLDAPPAASRPPDFRSGPSTATPLSPGARRALRRALFVREEIEHLRLLPAFAPPPTPTGPQPNSAIADRLREYIGVSITEQVAWHDENLALHEWRARFERRGILTLQFMLRRTDYRAALLTPQDGPAIVLNQSDSVHARVFSLMHELAHISLGGDAAVCEPLAKNPVEDAVQVERRCNAIAGLALVPH